MAVCIAGMHRSGTSMIARVLNLCGLHLGRADDLIPPGPDNPDGFWEHRHFVAINDALLAAFGGTWDAPPPLPPGWHKDPKLAAAYRRASELIREFRGSSGWGWKDPRNSLTLPFWRHLLPDIQVVVCLRNPLEVAASLRRRQGGVTPEAGLGLWLTYYHRLLGDLGQTPAVFTHYAAYFHDPVQEMRRVIDRLALPLAEETIPQAILAIRPHLRHHRVASAELVVDDVPVDLVRQYVTMARQAGPAYQAVEELPQPVRRMAWSGRARTSLPGRQWG